jgi:hypothetical protein
LPTWVDYFLFNKHRKEKEIRKERRLQRAAATIPLPRTVEDVERLHSGSEPDSNSDDDKAIISTINSARTKPRTKPRTNPNIIKLDNDPYDKYAGIR